MEISELIILLLRSEKLRKKLKNWFIKENTQALCVSEKIINSTRTYLMWNPCWYNSKTSVATCKDIQKIFKIN